MRPTSLEELILQNAGIDLVVPTPSDERFAAEFPEAERLGREALETFWTVYKYKTTLYGTHRLAVQREIPDYDLKMLYADISRKFKRLKHMVWQQKPDYNAILETVSDIGVYGAVGAVIVYLRGLLDGEFHEEGEER